jgi:hypothetical protein
VDSACDCAAWMRTPLYGNAAAPGMLPRKRISPKTDLEWIVELGRAAGAASPVDAHVRREGGPDGAQGVDVSRRSITIESITSSIGLRCSLVQWICAEKDRSYLSVAGNGGKAGSLALIQSVFTIAFFTSTTSGRTY